MSSKNKNFIYTSDTETADKLIDLGFNLIHKANPMYVFENNNEVQFSNDIDNKKIAHTNMLTF